MFIIKNPGVIISFALVFFQSVASFECFVFMALSVWIKNPYIEKCLLSTTPKPSCADTFPPIDCFSPVRGCNFWPYSNIVCTSCNILPILSCNSLCLEVTNPPFCTITHAMLDCVSFRTTTLTLKSF